MINFNTSLEEPYKKLKIVTYFFFLLLAAFPLMKENINSITIIITLFLFILNSIIFKKKITLSKKFIFLTAVFWMYFLHEIFTTDFTVKRILLHLPFLVFPLLFSIIPDYLDEKAKKRSLIVFQISVLLSSAYFLTVFLNNNNIADLFTISLENIPFFRDYIFKNASLDVHPTYFSVFLLVSFTISGYKILTKKLKQKNILFNTINIILVTFMMFLFSSRIVIVVLLLTILFLAVLFLKKLGRKRMIMSVVIIAGLSILAFIPFKKMLSQRFSEIITEYKKPVEGNYHNSTNIRVAILTCSLNLIQEKPLMGYGEGLQSELNRCYSNSYDSNFSENKNYNTHNYYLNLVLYGGWLFFLFFVSYLAYIAFKIKNSTLALLFLFQILFVNLTENYFSRHYGIITFNYFICLFYFFNIPRGSFING